MKIAVSGASGKTGYRIAEEAMKEGHSVTLITRENSIIPSSLVECKRLITSFLDLNNLTKCLIGIDTLIIATGARPSPDLTGPLMVDALGVKNQVECCRKIGLKRVILVSSLCSGKLFHPLNFFGLILMCKRIGEKSLESSGLDWTIVRPGGLNEEEDSEFEGIKYTGKNKQFDGSISRRLVAKCCVESIEEKLAINKIIEITSSKSQNKVLLSEALKEV